MRRLIPAACLVLAAGLPLSLSTPSGAQEARAPEPANNLMARATRYVEDSNRYLHHSRLQRGMEGYGLTVLAGTKIVKFRAVVESVMTEWGPHQAVILARLSGHNLEGTKIISGMSGSPVFMKDPRDGQYKMIGAVAYGWQAQNEPLCGIQPITQMLAVSGVLNDPNAPAGSGGAKERSPDSAGSGSLPEAWRSAILDANGQSLNRWVQQSLARPGRRGLGAARNSSARLPVPIAVSGLSADSIASMAKVLAPAGFLPVQSGGAGQGDANADAVKLEPGSAIAVPLVRGDADWSAVGTVTEVIGDRVLAFGHSFYAEGEASYPMGTAYIHTVVSGGTPRKSGLDGSTAHAARPYSWVSAEATRPPRSSARSCSP